MVDTEGNMHFQKSRYGEVINDICDNTKYRNCVIKYQGLQDKEIREVFFLSVYDYWV